MASGKKMLIGGNWKCNGTVEKVSSLVAMLNDGGKFPNNAEVVIAPTALHVSYLVQNLRDDINVSVQNTWSEEKAGAWTGELTVDLVKDMGVNWTILGHSERRAYCGETPVVVAKKVGIALNAGMKVIACIGEKLEDREAGNTMNVCIEQLEPIIKAIPNGTVSNVVIAYEPVWAIGTGVTATPEQAQEVHEQLRAYLVNNIGTEQANAMRIIYGGSVKANNCDELMAKADIDGFLVGGASLTEEFLKIINSTAAK
mmetsp:Transcript_5222/g.6581  ORF Transcript_5222/g.6581 Transcript_5222/m.6581 type:complete len:256 (-) Transcript_5222:767-1534(-)|eukprot:CAMPEP_0204823088 /NCGR_PEP_ID=MMETSP1346-20131115/1230_1 /ASSEMBLY_ACC=CAM_ASM_000771 /TAXON_ID=215587 /ORGANISM="Aplanochytrium stocchinoi, Strain GSBS06" /LENGTH=255 /DNA_ID=CAMNT_0051949621 /DNA_START=90 /DNA_END=857 /DNA_ORIENTATION=+